MIVIVQTYDGIKGIDEATWGLWIAPQATKNHLCGLSGPFRSGSNRRTVAQEAYLEN